MVAHSAWASTIRLGTGDVKSGWLSFDFLVDRVLARRSSTTLTPSSLQAAEPPKDD